MRIKLLSLFAFSIFALVFVMSAVSAVTLAQWPLTADGIATSILTGVNAGTFTNNSVTLTFSPTNGATGDNWPITGLGQNSSKYFEVTISPQTGNTLSISQIVFNYSRSSTGPTVYAFEWDDNAAFSSPLVISAKNPTTSEQTDTNSSLNINASAGQTIYLRWFAYDANSTSGTLRVKNLVISGTVTPVTTTTVPPEVTACTATGNPGELDVRKIDFKNNGLSSGTTFGKDDEWFPFEELEVEMEIENNGNDDVDDISVEWGLWDTDKNKWVIDLDEEDEINLKDGDQETLTATFQIDDDMDVNLDELSDGDNYRLYVVATGTVDNSTSPETCVSDFEQVSIVIESDFVVVDNIQVPETLQCGETATVTADVWNIGNNDQDEVSVYVSNTALELAEDVAVGDMDAFDSQRISFSFTVPNDAEEKTYPVKFEVLDEDNDVYKNDFDDDLAEFTMPLKVEGSCGVAPLTVTANLVSGGKAGQDLVVKAVVTNSGTSSATYAVNAAGFAEWASSYTVEPATLALAAGQSGEALFTFDVNRDASGEQTFFIEIASGGEITRQPVSVSIEPSGFLGITGLAIGGNTGLWALGLLNVVLVVVIILVAVRIARRK